LSSLWVIWGTGDKEAPKGTGGTDHFFALKDNDRKTFYNISNFQDITATGAIYNGTTPGWYIRLAGAGEKILFDPTVFGGIALFSTYTPPAATDPCNETGAAKLYAMALMQVTIGSTIYQPGAGVLSTGGARSVTLSTIGMAKSPVLSQKPLPGGGATDIYMSLSGGGGQNSQIISGTSTALSSTPLTQRLGQTAPSPQVLHWNDRRIQ
jgi:type IV pilus assembly protein PilY1